MDDTLHQLKVCVESALKPIIAKGAAISAAELDIATKAVCLLEKIKWLGEVKEDYSDHEASGRSYGSDKGHSGHSVKDRMIARLEEMMDEAKGDYERRTVEEWIRRLQD